MTKLRLVFIFFFIFLFFNFLTSFLATKYIPYLGFFPYKDVVLSFKLPNFIAFFANFDGAHYLSIVRRGYREFEQAFFPLYPLAIIFLVRLLKINGFISAFLISNASFFIGLILSFFLLEKKFKKNQIVWFYVFFLLFPTSFFFSAIYTEGLFFMLFIATLFFLKRKKYLIASLFAFFAATTRLIGVLLIVPILMERLANKKIKLTFTKIVLFLSPLLGLFSYSFYLYKTTGDPFFFFNSQPVFGANRSTKLILLPQVYYRYLKIFLTTGWSFQYFISLVEICIFTFVFVVLLLDFFRLIKPIKNYEEIGLNLFSLINLILPTLTGTFSSVPRYALFSLSFFIALSRIKNLFFKILIAIIFFILHFILLGFFIQGYFVS